MYIIKTGVCALAVFFCVLTPVQAQSISTEETYRQTLIALVQTLQEHISQLQAQLAAQQVVGAMPAGSVTGPSAVERERFSDTVPVIARYRLDGGEALSAIPYLQYRQYLERIEELFPAEYEQRLGEFIVFNGEDSYFDAFVETIPPDHEMWAYAVNDELTDEVNAPYNTELIVHELAHLIGYDEVPGSVRPLEVECAEYFARTNCPLNNSYLGRFTEQFWSEAELGRAIAFAEEEDPIREVEEYYDERVTEYVSSYAATNPEEDFAESFLFFVLEPLPEEGEALEKVEFFADFPELNEMRREIRRQR